MKYTVKSKHGLEEFIEILESEHLPITYETTKCIEVEIENSREFDIFANTLSFYVSYSNYREFLRDYLVRRGKKLSQAERLTRSSMQNMANSNYFYTFTRILVREYLKKSTTLNIEAFLLFNMKGFKEEVRGIGDSIIGFQDGTGEFDNGYGDTAVGGNGIGVQDIFGALRERAVENGLDLSDFKEIHVYQVENRLQLKNKKGLLLDEEFLMSYLGSALQFSFDESANPMNKELIAGVMVCSCLISIFDITKVVIHKTVSKEANDSLLYTISTLKKQTGRKIKTVICNGCDQCE